MTKKAFAVAAVVLLGIGNLMAQNSFKGIVKYDVKSTGVEAITIPEEVAKAEIRVSGDKLYTNSPIFASGMVEYVLVNGLTSTQCLNLSQLLGYLRSQGSEFTYQGDGKLIVKSTSKESDFDSLAIKDEEPGHFYYEYVDGETKQIAGKTAKKIVRHTFDDEGIDHPMEMWYSDEIGPRINILFGGIKGMPLEVTMEAGENKAITYTATEIVSGKVKDADFLLPSGYETLSDEDFETLMQEINDELELLQD